MDEHWDGGGQPAGLQGDRIPLLGQIVGLSQVLEIFTDDCGASAAIDVAQRRAGSWFNPTLVDAATTLRSDTAFWAALASGDPQSLVNAVEPPSAVITADECALDRLSEAFASVVDAKSPYTYDSARLGLRSR